MAEIVSDLTLHYDDFFGAPSFQKCQFWALLQERLTHEVHLANEPNIRLAVRAAMHDGHDEVRNEALRTVLTIVYQNHAMLDVAEHEAHSLQNYLLSQAVDERSQSLFESRAQPLLAVLTNCKDANRGYKLTQLNLTGQICIPH